MKIIPHPSILIEVGDSLRQIALDMTGDAERYVDLARCNGLMPAVSIIHPGEIFRIPNAWLPVGADVYRLELEEASLRDALNQASRRLKLARMVVR